MASPTIVLTAPSRPPVTPGGSRLIDCEVCSGLGVMTARAVGDVDGPGTPVPCPNCGGAGVFLRPVENVVTDLADWAADTASSSTSRPAAEHREAAGWRRLAAASRQQARCCISSARTASNAKDVEDQCELGLRYLRSAASYDAAAFAIELGAVQPRPVPAGQQ